MSHWINIYVPVVKKLLCCDLIEQVHITMNVPGSGNRILFKLFVFKRRYFFRCVERFITYTKRGGVKGHVTIWEDSVSTKRCQQLLLKNKGKTINTEKRQIKIPKSTDNGITTVCEVGTWWNCHPVYLFYLFLKSLPTFTNYASL